jgi:hypothetical protein
MVSLKPSYPLLRRTRVPNLGRWIIYTENAKKITEYKNHKYKDIDHEQNRVYPWQGSQIKSSFITAQSVCSHLKHFAHRIQSSPVRSSEKQPVQYRQSASCSSSSSVASSAWGTANLVSESDGVSDGVGTQQTLLFRLFEGPRRAFDAFGIFGFSGLFDFLFELPQQNFVKWTLYFLCCSTTRIWV